MLALELGQPVLAGPYVAARFPSERRRVHITPSKAVRGSNGQSDWFRCAQPPRSARPFRFSWAARTMVFRVCVTIVVQSCGVRDPPASALRTLCFREVG
jgi:hypothetical protein